MPCRREPDGNFTWAARAIRTVPGSYQPVARASMNPARESAASPTTAWASTVSHHQSPEHADADTPALCSLSADLLTALHLAR
jgi:hypothetical protein